MAVPEKQDASSCALVLEQARGMGDATVIADLERIGAHPYADSATDVVKSRYAGNFTPAEAAELVEVMAAARLGALRVSHGLQLANPMELGFTTYDRLRAELVNFDARTLGTSFTVPLLFFQGERCPPRSTSMCARCSSDSSFKSVYAEHVLEAGALNGF